MNRYFYSLCFLISQVTSHCQPNNIQEIFSGNWKLLQLSTENRELLEPSKEQEILIHFLENNTFQGTTEYNKFDGTFLILDSMYMEFEVKFRTEIYEREFGNLFFAANDQAKIFKYRLVQDTLFLENKEHNISMIFNKKKSK